MTGHFVGQSPCRSDLGSRSATTGLVVLCAVVLRMAVSEDLGPRPQGCFIKLYYDDKEEEYEREVKERANKKIQS